MLNISENSITNSVSLDDYKSYKLVQRSRIRRLSMILVSLFFFVSLIALLLPWTQNISAKGYVTTRSPEQRPQAIQSVISGRLEKWYVREGDFVKKGDTIVFISEVKNEYFDPDLLERTSEQVDAKAQSIESYQQKIEAIRNQTDAIKLSQGLKLDQTKNKIQQTLNKISMDSIDLANYITNLDIAKNQLARTKELQEKGLKSLTDLQEKDLKVQSEAAKVNVQENKILNLQNEFQNLKIELAAIDQEYSEKLSKAQSEIQTALSNKLESVVETSKLKNQLSNYSERQKLYYVTAPQAGFITKALKKGIGETIKEATDIVTIMPADYDLALEIYLKPQDIPLLSIGNQTRIRFDGWPAIVISGWPESSTGIFSGTIMAIDQNISDNGFYRVMIMQDETDRPWPEKLRVGTGANAFILLNNVPIWYELWRQLNGFPPEFYSDADSSTEIKRKAPIKSIK